MKKQKTPKPPTIAEIRGDNIFATVPEVSRVLRVHRSTIYRMIERGTLPVAEGFDAVRIPWDAVEKISTRTPEVAAAS